MTERRPELFGKALDLWQAPDGAGEPLVCLATTFTFDVTFFETECLGRFVGMDSHPSESESIGYLIEREEKLSAVKAAVLVDRRHARDKESMRWDVIPVQAGRSILHSKLAVLCWSRWVRVIIGSGNLTPHGYRSNVEVFGTLDVSESDGACRERVLECLDFLEKVMERALGDVGTKRPRGRARASLDRVRVLVSRWKGPDPRRNEPYPVFGGVGQSVLDQVGGLWPASGPPRCLCVTAPFFEPSPADVDVAHALMRVLAKRRPREVYADVPTENLPSGETRVANRPRKDVSPLQR